MEVTGSEVLEKQLHELRARLEAREGELGLLEDILDSADTLICVYDAKGRVLEWNRAAEEITGHARASVSDGGIFHRLFPRRIERREIMRATRNLDNSERRLDGFETEIHCRDGNRKILSWSIQAKTRGNIRVYIAMASDITHIKQGQLQMEQMAFYDTLTELPNRRLFRDRLRQAVDTARRKGSRLAVMFLDLDRFKRINDSLGHAAGDELLRHVSQRIIGCVRSQDTVARLGGDEFTVLLTELTDAATASVVATKISEVLRKPILLGSNEVFVTSSIGISIAPDDSSDVTDLLRNADLAMYRAKERGRNNFQYFTEELNRQVSRQMALATELGMALEAGQFQIHFQPVFTMDGETIVGLEALLRWQHPSRGLVFPEEFMEVLEETGMIVELGAWILRQACTGARRLQTDERVLPVAVNLSARQFRQNNLPQLVESVLKEFGLDPQLLHLEITETMLMEDVDHSFEILRALKQLGVGLYIDDFGAGYFSLTYLRSFPVDVLKVDRSFVRNIPEESRDMEITAAIIAMAHELKLKVVAEGVETREQLAFLQQIGCDRVQGYYCSVPTDEDGLDYLLRINR